MATPDQMIQAAARRARLAELIATTPLPTARGLAQEVGVSHKTVVYDLRLLREAGVIEWDQDPSGRIRQGSIRRAPARA